MAGLSADQLQEVFAPDDSYLEYLRACEEESDEDYPIESEPEPPPPPPRRRPETRRDLDGAPLSSLWANVPLNCIRKRSHSTVTESGRRLLTEAELCRELLSNIRGLAVQCVAGRSLSEDFEVEGISRPALESLSRPLLEAAGHRAATEMALSSLRASRGGHRRGGGATALVPSLTSVCTALLSSCDQLLSRATGRKSSTLLGAAAAVDGSGVAATLRACAIATKEACRFVDDPCGVRMLMDRILQLADRRAARRHLSMHHNTDPIAAIGLALLCGWLSDLGGWMSSGRLGPDTYQPQPILVPPTLLFITQKGLAGTEGEDWEGRWTLDPDRVPACVGEELAKVALTCGKTARFLARTRTAQQRAAVRTDDDSCVSGYCDVPTIDLPAAFCADMVRLAEESGAAHRGCGGAPVLDVAAFGVTEAESESVNRDAIKVLDKVCGGVGALPLLSHIRKALEGSIRRHSALVSDELLAALRDQCEVPSRLEAVRRFLLLQQGAAMQHWCERCFFPSIDRPDACSRRTPVQQLRVAFESALVATGVRGQQLADTLRLVTMAWDKDSGSAAATSFTGSRAEGRIPEQLRAAGGLALSLRRDTMIAVAIPEEAATAHTRAFQVLMMVAYCKHLLVRTKLPKAPWAATAVERLVILARLQMLRFVNAMFDFLLHSAGAVWEGFMKDQQQARDVDTYRAQHLATARKLLDSLCHSSRSAMLWHTLQDILTLIVSFTENVRPYATWMEETLHDRGMSRGGRSRERPTEPPRFKRDLREYIESRVLGILRRYMNLFIQMTVRSDRSEALLASFDFNHFYRSR